MVVSLPIVNHGQQYLTYTHDGLTRDYILYLPNNLPDDAPLVFMLHGYSGSANGIMNYCGMNQLAVEHKFVVCYPQGTDDDWGNNFWNVGYEFHSNETVDDVGFITALADYLQTNYNLSKQFTFCSGMSNGGDMSYMLACQASETFLSVAPVAGCMMKWIYDMCQPEKVMPIFATNGTDDDITFWEGDINNEDGWGAYMGVMDAINFWSELNNTTDLIIEMLPDTDPNDGSTITAEKYIKGTNNQEVWLYKIVNGGHDWPGAWGNMDIDTSEEIWAYFEMVMNNTIAGGSETEMENNLVSFYPNPAKSVITVQTSGYDVIHYSIVNIRGQLLLTGDIVKQETKIDLSLFSDGIYLLEIGKLNHKLIINK